MLLVYQEMLNKEINIELEHIKQYIYNKAVPKKLPYSIHLNGKYIRVYLYDIDLVRSFKMKQIVYEGFNHYWLYKKDIDKLINLILSSNILSEHAT